MTERVTDSSCLKNDNLMKVPLIHNLRDLQEINWREPFQFLGDLPINNNRKNGHASDG